MAAAHVPRGTAFATKPNLALKMIRRVPAADVPFGWVAADSVYGVGDIEVALRGAGKGYVLGVSANRRFQSWHGPPPIAGTAEEIARHLDLSAWQRLSAGDGTKGARLHDCRQHVRGLAGGLLRTTPSTRPSTPTCARGVCKLSRIQHRCGPDACSLQLK
jgi:SRSO17 transposase